MLESKCIFWAEKIFFQAQIFFLLKVLRLTFMNIQKYFMKDKILCLEKHRTLGAWNRQFSSKGGGDFMQLCVLEICEAIFKSRGLIFRVEPHICIYFMDIISFFNLDDLKPAPASQIPKNALLHEIPSPSLRTKLAISST